MASGAAGESQFRTRAGSGPSLCDNGNRERKDSFMDTLASFFTCCDADRDNAIQHIDLHADIIAGADKRDRSASSEYYGTSSEPNSRRKTESETDLEIVLLMDEISKDKQVKQEHRRVSTGSLACREGEDEVEVTLHENDPVWAEIAHMDMAVEINGMETDKPHSNGGTGMAVDQAGDTRLRKSSTEVKADLVQYLNEVDMLEAAKAEQGPWQSQQHQAATLGQMRPTQPGPVIQSSPPGSQISYPQLSAKGTSQMTHPVMISAEQPRGLQSSPPASYISKPAQGAPMTTSSQAPTGYVQQTWPQQPAGTASHMMPQGSRNTEFNPNPFYVPQPYPAFSLSTDLSRQISQGSVVSLGQAGSSPPSSLAHSPPPNNGGFGQSPQNSFSFGGSAPNSGFAPGFPTPATDLPVKKQPKPRSRGTLHEYRCGYCSRIKTSTSSCGDGRVRIRCECGGQHQDGKSRMHATWVPIHKEGDSCQRRNSI